MVAVITNPVSLPNEHTIIDQLFDEGLEVLHLRKPYYLMNETENLLTKINSKYHSKIALHQHHALLFDYNLQRIHYTENDRKKISGTDLEEQRAKSITLSTSIHQIDEYNNLSDDFTYCFFGPVFNSLSKPGYRGVITDGFELTERTIKIIAIGGIDENRIEAVKDLGFSGIALLGSLWQSKNPIEHFKRIQKKWLMTESLY